MSKTTTPRNLSRFSLFSLLGKGSYFKHNSLSTDDVLPALIQGLNSVTKWYQGPRILHLWLEHVAFVFFGAPGTTQDLAPKFPQPLELTTEPTFAYRNFQNHCLKKRNSFGLKPSPRSTLPESPPTLEKWKNSKFGLFWVQPSETN